jgi:hypothetical protein
VFLDFGHLSQYGPWPWAQVDEDCLPKWIGDLATHRDRAAGCLPDTRLVLNACHLVDITDVAEPVTRANEPNRSIGGKVRVALGQCFGEFSFADRRGLFRPAGANLSRDVGAGLLFSRCDPLLQIERRRLVDISV